VVPPLGFLDALEIVLKVLLGEPGSPVKPLQLFLRGVALPIGAGNREQLESPDRTGRRQVGAAAEVDEFALAVEGDGLLFAQALLDVFDL
jgi:hypothetical protein